MDISSAAAEPSEPSSLTPAAQLAVDRLGYTVTQTAAALGVSRPTVYGWIVSGKLRATKVGGLRFVTRESIDALLTGGDDAPA